MNSDISEALGFLKGPTPEAWVDCAVKNQELMLIDHAHCEKKAASTALSLMYRYVEYPDLLHKLSRLAREELRHFEQVLTIMQKRNIEYTHLEASNYVKGLRVHIHSHEPYRLVDTLIVGAYIEARSCERFAVLIPHLDEELASFYTHLLSSEARHFKDYLFLAEKHSDVSIDEKVSLIGETEYQLITSADESFRFHSGVSVVN
jgi:tRNA 2-(methylsulfanyl)-N6-isopentenyladenosine37 hydroxylase